MVKLTSNSQSNGHEWPEIIAQITRPIGRAETNAKKMPWMESTTAAFASGVQPHRVLFLAHFALILTV